jgi:hypothetical protein
MRIFTTPAFRWSALVLTLAMLACPYSRAADAGACYAIADQDQRTYCLAKAHGEPATCYAIQRADLRAQCRAEVRK